MASGNFTTRVVATPPLTVDQFFSTPPPTPGNVGVCLSGGGSRALTAGMGQLQALASLTANGLPLLGQVKALSTVSGGSWLGVPFEFLRASGPSDAAYLGAYNANQGSVTTDGLGQLPAGNAGVPLTSDFFLPELLAVEAYLLHRFEKVPTDMLWQTVIALNILSAYDLFVPGTNLAPTDLFSYNQQSLQQILAANPSLVSSPAYLIADAVGSGRIRRPYLICNMGMLLVEPNTPTTGTELLAPVQATPFFTGIVGAPSGVDANGLAPGGGGITSFAFNSIYVSEANGSATASQLRQWSLTDIVGTSSAFFAEKLENQIKEWADDPLELARILLQYADDILKWIERHLDPANHAEAKTFVTHHATATTPDDLAVLKFSLPDLAAIDPAYYYWPAKSPAVVAQPKATRFADGGSLENTGVNGMLAYNDIDSLIVFVNTEEAMVQGTYGISDGHGGYLPNTNIVVDESIPPLFGYQPYESGEIDERNKGYVLYAGASGTDYPQYAHNQVFDSTQFAALLQGLWAASAANTQPAIFQQSLVVQPNSWFGVKGGKTVTVVWYHLSAVSAWTTLFQNNGPVAAVIAEAVKNDSFPHYNTIDTSLSATQINLLSYLTAWCVVATDQRTKRFSNLFRPGA